MANLVTLYIISLVLSADLLTVNSNAIEECISGPSYQYAGKISTTKSGLTCQRWDTNVPHVVSRIPSDGGHHNYCRSPDHDPRGTWCYTTDPNVRWEYCSLLKCDDGSLVVWTSFIQNGNLSYLEHGKADPEIATSSLPQNSKLSQDFKGSRIKCLESGKDGQEIYFTDVSKNSLSVFNIKSKEVSHLMKGTAQYIYAISQDWLTGNLYWTDTRMRSVMVADGKINSKISIYTPTPPPSEPRAIAVIQKKRKIVFSTFLKLNRKPQQTEIIETDMAGNGKKIIFQYPDVTDVTGLASDDERIYWTDNVGYASKIMSSRHDGSDKTQHHLKKLSLYQDIAVFQKYIYAADSRERYNYFDHLRYHIDAVRSDSSQIFTYTRPGIPRGITVVKKVLPANVPEKSDDEKKCLDSCAGLCLPTVTKSYKCQCAPGQFLQQSTNICLPNAITDEFLIVLDEETGYSYRIPLNFKYTNHTYSTTQFGITELSVDPQTGEEYFYDSSKSKIWKGITYKDTNAVYDMISSVKHLIINPLTKDVYFIDTDSNIILISADGNFRKTIQTNKGNKVDRHMLAIDTKQKYIYWTETSSDGTKGRVMLSRFSGKPIREVASDVGFPRELFVEAKSGKLFVMDPSTSTLHEISQKGKKVSKKKHDIQRLNPSRKFSFSGLVVYNEFAYITDKTTSKLMRYEIGSTKPEALSEFGPSTLYQPRPVTVYSKSLYNKYHAKSPNPCKTTKCKIMCLAINRKKSKCIFK